jgi:uncharacterized protein (DUF849 family)
VLSKKALLKKVNFPTPREEKVFWNLKRYGSPLSRPGTPGLDLTLEETLAEALILSRRFAYVAQVWPVVFSLNAENVDMDHLEALAREMGYGAVLGFFLNVVRALMHDPDPMDAELRLLDTRPQEPEMFFLVEHGPMMVELAERRSPDQALDWNFRMVTPLSGFQETFDTFVR